MGFIEEETREALPSLFSFLIFLFNQVREMNESARERERERERMKRCGNRFLVEMNIKKHIQFAISSQSSGSFARVSFRSSAPFNGTHCSKRKMLSTRVLLLLPTFFRN